MTKQQAKKIQKELEAICEKHGLWVKTEESRKPELRDIVLTISMRITKE